jgi:hypothetical protein
VTSSGKPGAAGAPIRDTVETPTVTPMSPGNGDDGDEPEPTMPELSSAGEIPQLANKLVDNFNIKAARDGESSIEPELQAFEAGIA